MLNDNIFKEKIIHNYAKMANNYPKLPFNEILEQSIKITGLSVSQFSSQSGIDLPDRFYRALKPSGVKLGVDTLHQISNRFPELNMDRFIRLSGPPLLSELCDSVNTPIALTRTADTKSEEYYLAIIQGKDNEIKRQEEEIRFLRGLLTK